MAPVSRALRPRFHAKINGKNMPYFSFHPPLYKQQKGVNKREQVTVFEGFFAFLFYPCLTQKLLCENRLPLPEGHAHFLVLNFHSFYKKSLNLIENHAAIHRYLDLVMVGLKLYGKPSVGSINTKTSVFYTSSIRAYTNFEVYSNAGTKAKPEERQTFLNVGS